MIFYIPWTDRLILALGAGHKTAFVDDEHFEIGLMTNPKNAIKFGWVYIGEI